MSKYNSKHWTKERLLKPDFANMTQEERNLRAIMLAYLVLHPIASIEMDEAELNDVMFCEICNTIGDKAFVEWNGSDGE